VGSVLVNRSEVGGKILAEAIDLLQGIIEELHAACVKVVCYLFNEGSILARKGQCDLVRYARLDWCCSNNRSDWPSAARRTVFQEQFADTPQLSVLEDKDPTRSQARSLASQQLYPDGDVQQFL
jgi:hypothetical protein